MENIEFRGKRIDNQELICGDLIHGRSIDCEKMYIVEKTSKIDSNDIKDLKIHEVIPETVKMFIRVFD